MFLFLTSLLSEEKVYKKQKIPPQRKQFKEAKQMRYGIHLPHHKIYALVLNMSMQKDICTTQKKSLQKKSLVWLISD